MCSECTDQRIDQLLKENVALKNQLASLKRSDPKFNVEQIVVSNYNGYASSFWIHGRMWGQDGNTKDWGWHYTQQRKDSPERRWVPESQLRKQTMTEQTGWGSEDE